MNRVILFGRLGNDPELKLTAGGAALLKLRLATTEKVKTAEGWKDETEWHNVTMWGKRAEALSRHLSKGSKVLIEGKLHSSSYEDRDGKRRTSTEVIAESLDFGSDKRRAQQGAAQDPGGEDDPY